MIVRSPKLSDSNSESLSLGTIYSMYLINLYTHKKIFSFYRNDVLKLFNFSSLKALLTFNSYYSILFGSGSSRLGEIKTNKKIVIGCLNDHGHWIFLPKSIKLSASENNTDFNMITNIDYGIPKEAEKSYKEDIALNFQPIKTRYLRVYTQNLKVCPEWHGGAGGKALIFVDEIIVE